MKLFAVIFGLFSAMDTYFMMVSSGGLALFYAVFAVYFGVRAIQEWRKSNEVSGRNSTDAGQQR